jgi:hypothetical protein
MHFSCTIKKHLCLLVVATVLMAGCKKESGGNTNNPTPPVPEPPVEIKPQVDPPLAKTIGFFLDDWAPKSFTTPAFNEGTVPTTAATTVTVDYSNVLTKVPRSISGANANLWMTQIVTESALMNHLTQLKPNHIRFPGGSISDVFFWNAPKGVPPADAPAQLTKADGSKESNPYWFGKNAENWTLSVDNYYQLLQQTGNQGIITINYGYARYGTSTDPVAAAAHLAADWVRHDNGRTRYWEIGNENFGDWEAGYRIDRSLNKDGQPEYITGELYAQHFNVFADSMRKAAQEIGKTIYIGAVLFDSPAESWHSASVKTWNAGVFQKAGNKPDYYIVHSYFTPYNTQSNGAAILASAPAETKRLMEFVKSSVQAAGLAQKPVALTEWNIFAVGQKQQVSHVNGMHGVMVVGEALKNQYGLTARWDLANGWGGTGDDHGMFNNGDEPDGIPKWNPRPSFFHLYFFQRFLGDRFLGATVSGSNNLAAYASGFTSGHAGVTVVNTATTAQTATINLQNFKMGSRFYYYTLTGGDDNGEFSRKIFVNGQGPTGAAGGPATYASLKAFSAKTDGGVRIALPPRSVVFVAIEGK